MVAKDAVPLPAPDDELALAPIEPAVLEDLPISDMADDAEEFSAVDRVIGAGEPQRVGRFRFFLDGQRWEWSDAVARMHGYEPGTVEPTTELLLAHKHAEDRERVAAVLTRGCCKASRLAAGTASSILPDIPIG